MDENNSTIKHYSNGEITIVWKPGLCTHVASCFTELPEVFDPAEKPWINPHGASTEKIIDQIKRCPTGALAFFYNEKQNNMKNETNKSENTVRVEILENGPALVKGKCILVDKSGQETEKDNMFALCRCGKSKNKPFCDGSHLANPFE